MFSGQLKRMGSLLSLGRVFYKCQLNPIIWWVTLYSCLFFSLVLLKLKEREREIEIFNYSCGFVYFFFCSISFCFTYFVRLLIGTDMLRIIVNWFLHYYCILALMSFCFSGNSLSSKVHFFIINIIVIVVSVIIIIIIEK